MTIHIVSSFIEGLPSFAGTSSDFLSMSPSCQCSVAMHPITVALSFLFFAKALFAGDTKGDTAFYCNPSHSARWLGICSSDENPTPQKGSAKGTGRVSICTYLSSTDYSRRDASPYDVTFLLLSFLNCLQPGTTMVGLAQIHTPRSLHLSTWLVIRRRPPSTIIAAPARTPT